VADQPITPPFDGVVYQVYPRSFADASGDGIGDLAGITQRLDHLAWLGVDAVWLSPIYRSPMADFGYDVADHTAVDPVFGTLADVDRLIEEAHRRHLGVWLDWVPNHTSDQHAWFQASRSSREDPKRDWYIWRDPAPDGGPPTNWTRHFADEPAWTFDDTTGQYYLHLFLPEQPDVNWANPELRAAMHDVLRFWMDRGVDGFRADVIHLIGKDPAWPDDPDWLAGIPRAGFHHVGVTHDHIRTIRQVLDGYPGRLMVGEINLPDAAQVATYVNDAQLHLAFFFGLIYAPWEARSWRDTIRYVDTQFDAVGAWPTWAMGNHDNPRIATRLAGGERRARAAAVALLTLRGVPFVYAGDELGLEDADVPSDRVVDPGGRDGCRAPIPWDGSPAHGWGAEPWLPWPPDADTRNAATLRDHPSSILHLYRRLLALRRSAAALRVGAQAVPDVHDEVVALHRWVDDASEVAAPTGAVGRERAGSGPAGADAAEAAVDAGDTGERLVLISFTAAEVTVHLDDRLAGAWVVELASDGAGEGDTFHGRLAPDQAVVLRRP
jgi:alpha-glucosidase